MTVMKPSDPTPSQPKEKTQYLDPKAGEYLREGANIGDMPGDQSGVTTPRATDNTKAHQQADADIAADPDLGVHSKTDDQDEGELARLDNSNG